MSKSLKVKITISNNCNLCGKCVSYCPTYVYSFQERTLQVHEERCIYCKGCEPLCPQNAIKVELLDEGLQIEKHRTLSQL